MISSSCMNNNLAGDSLGLCAHYIAVRLLLGGTVVSGFLSTCTSSTGSQYYCDNQYTNTGVPLCVCSVAVCTVSKAVIIDM